MLKRLQYKIIWINMLLSGILLLGVMTVICANTYRTSALELESGLRSALEQTWDVLPIQPFFREPHPEKPEWRLNSYTLAMINESGEILSCTERNASLPERIISEAVRKVLESEEWSGILSNESLMFVRRDMSGGIRIAFTSTNGIKYELSKNIAVSAVLFIVGLAVIFGISLALSYLAVRPVKNAWDKQKQFIADASHELKTPLTVILANIRILLSHSDETLESQKQWILATDEEAKTMRRMVEQMLELARTDIQEVKTELTDVDVSALLEGCALCFDPSAYEKNIRIECAIVPGIVIPSDPERMTQLCRILLDNAVKYADCGSRVQLSFAPEGRKVLLRVHNEGTPIPPEEQPLLFDRFYRTDKARGEGGFGLGLAIARSIVDSLEGTITVESSAEKGTAFTVVLPR